MKGRLLVLKIGFISAVGMFFLMAHTFMAAFLHPSKTVLIGIDWMGEAWIELILLMVMTPSVLYLMWRFRDYLEFEKERGT